MRERIHSILRPQPLPPPRFAVVLRLFLSALPLLILLGDALTRKSADPVLFTPITIAALAGASLALLAHHLLQRRLVRLLAGISAVLALVAVVRMGHFSAPLLGFWPLPGGFLWALSPVFGLVVSLALFGAAGSSRRHFWAMLNMCLGLAVLVLALLGVIGELYEMLRWFELDQMTTRTLLLRGTAQAALGAALLAGTASTGLSWRGLRRWMHVPATVAVLFLAILFAALLRLEEIRDLRTHVHARVEQAAGLLQSRFDSGTYELRRMASAIAHEGPAGENARRMEAWNYIQQRSELEAMARVNIEFGIRWTVPARRYPVLTDNTLDDRLVPAGARRPGRFAAEPVVGDVVDLPEMGSVFTYFVPARKGRMPDGYLVGFFRVDTFMHEALGESLQGFGAIVQDERDAVVHDFGSAHLQAGRPYLVTREWRLGDRTWRLHGFPGRQVLYDGFTVMPVLVLLLGALLSVTFGITLYQTAIARVSLRRLQREVQRRARLEQELRTYQRNLETLVEERTRELEARNRELRRVARTDALTGVFNRGRFEEEFGNMLERARRYSRPLTLCLIDLDHFKRINDTHGHAAGDEVLRRVCELFRPILRDADVFARYGGEEFALLMAESGLETALPAMERLRRALEEEEFVLENDLHLRVTGSFGVAALTPDIDDREQLLQRADEALYRAKANGRNRVEHAGDTDPGTAG